MKYLVRLVYDCNEMHQNIIFEDETYLITSIWRREKKKIPNKNKR